MIGSAELHDTLLAVHGPQHWWPAADDEVFEIMVGALLVQRTAWHNAAGAIEALRRRDLLTPAALTAADIATVATCIRGAGFFRSKAARLMKLARYLHRDASIDELRTQSTPGLRRTLLALDGIGPETADAILLYAFERPAAVVDEYLRRLAGRLANAGRTPGDGQLREWVLAEIDDVPRLNELHALVVAHGKTVCGRRPRCEDCALRRRCRTGRTGRGFSEA